jgi:hypothetical protein
MSGNIIYYLGWQKGAGQSPECEYHGVIDNKNTPISICGVLLDREIYYILFVLDRLPATVKLECAQ